LFGPGSLAAYRASLTDALRMLRAADGSFAVLGNHDHWSDPNMIRGMLDRVGVRNLSNAAHTLRRGEATLHLAGVDDVWEQQDRLDDVLDVLPDEGAAILLAHEPDFADDSALTGRFDLQLSGHSHGGQVNLPLFGRPRLPRLGLKYPAGLYQVQSMQLYTNRGLGVVWPRVRFNCRPELTVFTLESV
jgi:predicted MPP superfamily phosphohydrolase